MNEQAHKEYNALENKMNELIYQIEKIYEGDEEFLVPFRLSQVKWLEFVDLFINSRYPERQDPRYYGTLLPLCLSNELADITSFRVAQLKKWVDGTVEGDGCCGSYKVNSNTCLLKQLNDFL
jgi:hypothetical protein